MARDALRRRLVSDWYSGAAWLWLLRPVELFYRSVVALRRLAYRTGILPCYGANVPVVVVGNLTLGGTGKTPVVIALVEMLAARGLKAGVVCRGYGATRGSFSHIVDGDSTVEQCGDEALLIHRRTGCPCVVSSSRVAAVRSLLGKFEVDIVISDDGLQHYALGRDLEVLLYDVERRFGNGWCLPAGPLREPLSRLGEAHYIFSRGATEAADIQYRFDCVVHLVSGRSSDVAEVPQSSPLVAIAGIAHPENFAATLRRLGLSADLYAFPDHHLYTAKDFASLPEGTIIMTEKDAVKCRALVGENAWYVRVSAVLPAALVEAVTALATP